MDTTFTGEGLRTIYILPFTTPTLMGIPLDMLLLLYSFAGLLIFQQFDNAPGSQGRYKWYLEIKGGR